MAKKSMLLCPHPGCITRVALMFMRGHHNNVHRNDHRATCRICRETADAKQRLADQNG